MKTFSNMAMSALTLGIAGAANAHDDDIVTKTLDLSGFDQIEISGVYELDVRVGADYSVTLSGSKDEMDRVDASVKNGVLHLDRSERKRGERRWKFKKEDHGVDVAITLPSLIGLDVSGVVDGSVAGVDADRFDVDISGVGDLRLDGECGTLEADVSGVGDLDAKSLECRVALIEVSGVGGATVYASEEVDAEVSGMGDIDVYGSPQSVRKEGGLFADITVH